MSKQETPIEEQMQDLISEQIENISKGIAINADISLMQDLKRMSERGVLKVVASNEMPSINFDGVTVRTKYEQPRLIFTGEVEIVRLKAIIEELERDYLPKSEVKELIEQSKIKDIHRCLQIITNAVEDDTRVNHDESYLKIIEQCNDALKTLNL